MRTNGFIRSDSGTFYRVLSIGEDRSLVIDCTHSTMPRWMENTELLRFEEAAEEDLPLDAVPTELSENDRTVMHRRFTVIAPILSFLDDDGMRFAMIDRAAEQYNLSKQTVRKYLRLYLTYQQMEALAPVHRHRKKELSPDEKNFRWALNRYYYTCRKNSLTTAYHMMLKAKYTDTAGQLTQEYPPFHRFRYYYYKHRKTQRQLISRNGITDYRRNYRPLLGTVRDFAPAVGVGMLDSTVCDIYLVNTAGQLVGRPILTLCVDAYSSLICGYCLSWEGGVFSLNALMQNIIADKAEWCGRFRIQASVSDWPCASLPGVMVTDRGREYTGQTFEQITELGVRLVNLPSYRPELKGTVEGAFRNLQALFKPYLRGKGVIEPDFQERGAHDYRKDACLTVEDFEKILLYCILFYNSRRVLEGFPYTSELLEARVRPYANAVWEQNCTQPDANLIATDPERLRLTLLPRTVGRFTRKGLIVHKQRYRHCEGNCTERYLNGGSVTVAYNPDDVSCVWLYENGEYTPFEIILQIYGSMSLAEVARMRERQREMQAAEKQRNAQARVDLAKQIETVAGGCVCPETVSLKNIRKTHAVERKKRHLKENGCNSGNA